MNFRRTTVMLAIAMAVGGALSMASPAGAATASTFGALVPSTFMTVYGPGVAVPESSVRSDTAPCPVGQAAVSVGGGGVSTLMGLAPGNNFTSGVATGRTGRADVGSSILAQATCAPTAQFAGTTVSSREQRVHSRTGSGPER